MVYIIMGLILKFSEKEGVLNLQYHFFPILNAYAYQITL